VVRQLSIDRSVRLRLDERRVRLEELTTDVRLLVFSQVGDLDAVPACCTGVTDTSREVEQPDTLFSMIAF
jgi:hypothetical protein